MLQRYKIEHNCVTDGRKHFLQHIHHEIAFSFFNVCVTSSSLPDHISKIYSSTILMQASYVCTLRLCEKLLLWQREKFMIFFWTLGILALVPSKHLSFSAVTSPRQQNQWTFQLIISNSYLGNKVLKCIQTIKLYCVYSIYGSGAYIYYTR